MNVQSSSGEKKKRSIAKLLGLNGSIFCSLAVLAAPAANGCEPTNDWCGVKPLVNSKCSTCHSAPPTQGAPISIMTYDHTQAAWSGTKVWNRMQVRVNQAGAPMPPAWVAPEQQLTAEEKTRLNNWFAAGAPRGTTPDGAACPQ